MGEKRKKRFKSIKILKFLIIVVCSKYIAILKKKNKSEEVNFEQAWDDEKLFNVPCFYKGLKSIK